MNRTFGGATLIMSLLAFMSSHTAAVADPDVGVGPGIYNVGDVEDAGGGQRIALTRPDPDRYWRLVNTCILEDGSIGGCAGQGTCFTPPGRTVRYLRVEYDLIADGINLWRWDGNACVDITDVAPQVTPAMVQAEFEELPLPLGEVMLQPPDGVALVNAGLIPFTTQAVDAPYDVEILGSDVHIDAFIVDYRWDFGDGASGAGRGGPYPDKTTLHVYTVPGAYTLTLTLTWDATYTIDGGPETPVLDTTTTTSDPIAITVVEANSILVDQY